MLMFWILGILTLLIPLLSLVLCWRDPKRRLTTPSDMAPYWASAGALLALVAVGGGAYIAHGAVAADVAAIANTAVLYQLFHSLGLVVAGALAGLQKSNSEQAIAATAWSFAFGIAFFSGALFLRSAGLLAISGLMPLGGTLFLIGWLAFAIALWRRMR